MSTENSAGQGNYNDPHLPGADPNSKYYVLALLSVLFCFFTMGFVDIVGTAATQLKSDLNLSDSQANSFSAMLFFWFFIISVPTSMLMNKIGRKNTVLLSVAVSTLGVLIPLFGVNYYLMLIAFSILGIGNAIMQTSLNPLVSNVVSEEKLPSSLTFGQVLKACVALTGPLIVTWGAKEMMPTLGFSWRVVFLIYVVLGIIAFVWLLMMPIRRAASDKVTGIVECLKLLGIPIVLLSFCGIICHVGIDVGMINTGPKLIAERVGGNAENFLYVSTVYFVCRAIGSFIGAGVLQKISAKIIFLISALLLICGLLGMIFISSEMGIVVCVAIFGLGNSNVFPIIFSQVVLRMPNEANELSGLMIMGLIGGSIFPFVMGLLNDSMGTQAAGIFIMLIGAVYLLSYTMSMRTENV